MHRYTAFSSPALALNAMFQHLLWPHPLPGLDAPPTSHPNPVSLVTFFCHRNSVPDFSRGGSFARQGSESESVNGPGRDSGLPSSSRHEPSATLPGKGGAEPGTEAMEGILCRKQEMESHNKKAASRWVREGLVGGGRREDRERERD